MNGQSPTKWYKWRVSYRHGYGDWEYVETYDIKDYLEERSYNPMYGAMDVFRADYEEIEKPPKEELINMIEELAKGIVWRKERIEELSKLL